MKKIISFALIIALSSVAALAQAAQTADVKGDWDMTVVTPRGDRTSSMIIVQDGEKIKVTMTSSRGESTGEGTVKEGDIEWSVTRTTPQGDMTMTYKGKVNGDSMAGDVQMGDFGSMTWTAVRKKA
ncbi:MAG: hypothetical protein A2Y86_09670 [Candidatus Aminicenantes bacterium RBG_13_62_12]|nr:MAG: hypothetical protein A2Y86_09670 [Candidatus Aminicenantes bacterium RBG_13_62_12]